MVFDDKDGSSVAATVQIISGERQGESQQSTLCGYWDYGCGFYFYGLPHLVPVTLRVSAPGYTTKEQTFMPVMGGYAEVVLLSRE
jgi:hypothetical protein